MFSQEYISNAVFRDFPTVFDPIKPEMVMDSEGKRKPVDTGFFVQKNGDVVFKINAFNADSVSIKIGRSETVLSKNSEGIYEGVLEYNEKLKGPMSVDVVIDGMVFLYPYAPIAWHRNRPVNFVNIPDAEVDYIMINDVPHGAVSREIYFSKTLNRWERCMIYTPPGYMKNDKEYPVLYLQHGATENETCWQYNGKVSYIIDNLLSQGKCEPFIIVMNNGMVRYSQDPMERGMDDAFENMLIDDCIPFIEENYRVKTDKWNRAMAGLSMGSMQTSKTGLTHPELFGYLGVFSGFMRFGPDHDTQTDDHLGIIFDNEKFLKEYKVFFRSIGDCDRVYVNNGPFMIDDGYCERSGINKLSNYTRKLYPGLDHDWNSWQRAIYDFAQLIFK